MSRVELGASLHTKQKPLFHIYPTLQSKSFESQISLCRSHTVSRHVTLYEYPPKVVEQSDRDSDTSAPAAAESATGGRRAAGGRGGAGRGARRAGYRRQHTTQIMMSKVDRTNALLCCKRSKSDVATV